MLEIFLWSREKMKNLVIVVVGFLLLSVAIWVALAIVSTLSPFESVTSTSPPVFSPTPALSGSTSCGGLEISITEIKVERNRIAARLKITNTTKNVIAIYPNQKSVVIGTTQFNADLRSGLEVSGEIEPGVIKSDTIIYQNEQQTINPNEFSLLKFNFGTAYNMKTYKSSDCSVEINRK